MGEIWSKTCEQGRDRRDHPLRMTLFSLCCLSRRRPHCADASAKELAASTADAARMLDRIRVRLASQKALLAELRDPAHPSGMKSFD